MGRLGRSRALWLLGLLALLVGGGIVIGSLGENVAPTASGLPAATWPSQNVLPSRPAAPSTPARSTPPVARPPQYAFPVSGSVSYARTHHDYPATDIIAACGSTVRAVTDGVVLEVNRVDGYDPHTDDGAERGGLFVSLLGDDGVRYYGSHLRVVGTGIDAGVRVRSGQALGQVGQTGDASVCHLHFGISPACAKIGDWWIRRGVVWPYTFLDSWRRRGAASPAGAAASWHRAHGCPSVTTMADQ